LLVFKYEQISTERELKFAFRPNTSILKMKKSLIIISISIIFLYVSGFSANDKAIKTAGENAYRANNLGVALLEQYDYAEATKEFKDSLELSPDFALAQVNLVIALFNEQKFDEAKTAAVKALELSPNSPQVNYVLGLIGRTENQIDESLAAFQKVFAIDPNDVGVNINIGQIMMQRKDYDAALRHFQTAYDSEPYNLTAIYNLFTALQRKGERERVPDLIKKFQELRETNAGTNLGLTYLEQGKYAEAIASTGAESELVDKSTPKISFTNDAEFLPGQKPQPQQNSRFDVKFSNKEKLLAAFEAGAAFFDFDGDGDSDLVKITQNGLTLYRNDSGKFVDVTSSAGDLAKPANSIGTGIVAGDFDNDKLPDLFVLRYGDNRVYHNDGNGKFTDVTAKVKLPKYDFLSISCAFVDADHDGDLDIFIAGFADVSKENIADFVFPKDFSNAPNMLIRNNGDSTFTDISEAAKIKKSKGFGVAIVPTDFDNRRDIDLLIANYGETPTLFRNLRDTTFVDVAEEFGLNKKGNWTSAAVGDYNKDSYPDFFFGANDGKSIFAESNGKTGYNLKDAPPNLANISAVQFFDYDNDGLIDLIAQTTRGFELFRNIGNGWNNESKAFQINKPNENNLANSRFLLADDVEADGDVDLLSFDKSGILQLIKNNGGNADDSITIQLTGRASNKTGVGAKLDLRAGSLTQKLETYAASPAPAPSEAHFGLGKREKPDALRIIWTSGTVQAEIEFPSAPKTATAQNFRIEELDRKPSSCPYLFTWNGENFEFITDFLGGGEMGNWAGQGVYHFPDADEYVRIPAGKLKPKNGRYEIRVTNELEEVLYFDKAELVAVDYDADGEVYPNEGLGIPTAGKFILYGAKNEKPPVSAVDGYGNDVLDRIEKSDRKFYDTFKSRKIRGYAEPHELTLKLDDKKDFEGKTLLFLTGWTDYAFSSDNLAASQSGDSLDLPKLQVKDKNGAWQTVIDSIGFSVGRPQTVVVDLTGKFLSASREVRILTNFKTFWDKISVSTDAETSDDSGRDFTINRLSPMTANLRERGFSKEVSPDGKEPFGADYDQVNFVPKWKLFAGSFTKTGDVLPLTKEMDDVFVISKTGDEISFSFDENAFPKLEKGKKRTFLLYASGYSKEMDINSGSPDAIFPLPFEGMSKYPYGADEKYPMTEEKRQIYDKYLTRRVFSNLPPIDAVLLK
jgi:tetratricopeptide (TPR) repeat protein